MMFTLPLTQHSMIWFYSVLYNVIWYMFSRVFGAAGEREEGDIQPLNFL